MEFESSLWTPSSGPSVLQVVFRTPCLQILFNALLHHTLAVVPSFSNRSASSPSVRGAAMELGCAAMMEGLRERAAECDQAGQQEGSSSQQGLCEEQGELAACAFHILSRSLFQQWEAELGQCSSAPLVLRCMQPCSALLCCLSAWALPPCLIPSVHSTPAWNPWKLGRGKEGCSSPWVGGVPAGWERLITSCTLEKRGSSLSLFSGLIVWIKSDVETWD